MGYQITEFGQDLLDDVRKLCDRTLEDQLRAADRSGEWPAEAYRAASEMGIGAAFIAEEYGGVDLELSEQAAVLEELAACDAGFAVSYMANRLAQAPVEIAGSALQKKLVYDVLLDGGFAGFCLTEDQAGSDISGCRTRAVRQGDHYVLDGNKLFVTNGPNAEIFVVFAVTDPDGGTKENLSAFLVPGDSEGLTRGAPEHTPRSISWESGIPEPARSASIACQFRSDIGSAKRARAFPLRSVRWSRRGSGAA